MSAGRGQGQRRPAPLTNNGKGHDVTSRKRAVVLNVAHGKRNIRTTFNPGQSIEVGDAEYLDLKRQGLIYEGDAPAADDKGVDDAITSTPTGEPVTDDEGVVS